ncbi:hypothetical protein [Pseudomonas panipatensis]|uniref:Uncharacterized protein n=1 Tax=Pseudomonas panipatensis TaxID=428992 RepID=A0A1G8CW76_9PSED|nr:hypothetical protein [Pseudomonas panipatensis]SDH49751.1 hypothetical protein SAMN05216272_101803 [Pseudomonas panipatensis]SMP63288.1 hypothetical protein SAMN06295951_10639 [Pseudomonas panipatensis]
MELIQVRRSVLEPALSLLPAKMSSPAAIAMILGIGLQESGFTYRRQMGNGPARGFWQMERGGGVHGVLTHSASTKLACSICAQRGVEPTEQAVWGAIEQDDILAAAFARLLLWTDVQALPVLGDTAGGWSLYSRVWRPGKPRPTEWPANYLKAMGAAA